MAMSTNSTDYLNEPRRTRNDSSSRNVAFPLLLPFSRAVFLAATRRNCGSPSRMFSMPRKTYRNPARRIKGKVLGSFTGPPPGQGPHFDPHQIALGPDGSIFTAEVR